MPVSDPKMPCGKSVVHLISSTKLDRGGPSLSATQLLQSLREAGQSGILVSPDHQSDTRMYASVSAITYPSVEALIAKQTAQEIRAFHLHGVWDWFLHRAVQVARKLNIPYVISPRGMLEPWAMNQKKWKKRLAWWLYQRDDLQHAAFLLATAQSEAEQFSRLGLSNTTVVIPNGVQLPQCEARFPNSLPHQSKAQHTALFLSRIHPKKGLLLLVEAWAKVRPQGWRMLVVGPDQTGHRKEVQALVDKHQLHSAWEFHEAMYGEDKAKAFDEADLFILPTFSENFGVAIAEALAYRLPVITTNQAPWEGLHKHRCGWWVAADTQGIAGALAQATKLDRDELQQMGERGSRWVQSEFAWSSIAKRLIAAYDQYIP
jgi:glycosyltransferase involved in cell wall biosynthesis